MNVGTLRMLCWGAVFALAAVFPVPVAASLGKDARSVEEDREQLQGQGRVIEESNYAVHEFKAATGTLIREYVSPSGRVFAVVWRGPFIPNLRQLLADYFERYAEAAQAPPARHVGHGPLRVAIPGLVVESTGRMRAFYGRAYLTNELPEGVLVEDIR
jgi:hypothetical protein